MYHNETPLVIETINFTTESLGFQNRHLNGAHSFSDIKPPWGIIQHIETESD